MSTRIFVIEDYLSEVESFDRKGNHLYSSIPSDSPEVSGTSRLF